MRQSVQQFPESIFTAKKKLYVDIRFNQTKSNSTENIVRNFKYHQGFERGKIDNVFDFPNGLF